MSGQSGQRRPVVATLRVYAYFMRTNVLVFLQIFAITTCAEQPGAGAPAPLPSADASGSPSDLGMISSPMVQAHNAVRSRVGVPPLIWSDQLAKVAQAWANRLLITHAFSHRPNNQYGENLYMISGSSASPSEVVRSWANEAKGYDILTNTCAGICGHYTQIVWAKTRAVGCAVATDQYQEVWVCNYDPPGNYVDYRPY
jgi:pathogenesis-related protein 1